LLLSIQSILPLFLMISLGYVFKRTIFDVKMLPGLNQFVYFLAVPALLFNASSQESIETLINLSALGAFVLAAALTGGITILGSRLFFSAQGSEQHIMRGLNGTFANYAYMGIPLTFGILGEGAYGAAISIILAGNLFLIGGAQLLIESSRHKHTGLKQVISILDKSLLRNPIFLSTVFGVLFSANQLAMPDTIQTVLDMLAPAAIPVALFCLGASLQISKTAISYAELSWMVGVKLCIHPALTWGCFYLLGIDDPIWMVTTVLLTSLPTGALAHVVAFKYGVFEKETSQIVVTSTILSLFSVSLWVSF
jgi:malonate transporter and related proteins